MIVCQLMSYCKHCLVGYNVPRFLGELDDGGSAGALVDILHELVDRGVFTLRFAFDLDIWC